MDTSGMAVEALADFLIERDWPSDKGGRGSLSRRYEYRTMAAAILCGEAWAIRKAWPLAAHEIVQARQA